MGLREASVWAVLRGRYLKEYCRSALAVEEQSILADIILNTASSHGYTSGC